MRKSLYFENIRILTSLTVKCVGTVWDIAICLTQYFVSVCVCFLCLFNVLDCLNQDETSELTQTYQETELEVEDDDEDDDDVDEIPDEEEDEDDEDVSCSVLV